MKKLFPLIALAVFLAVPASPAYAQSAAQPSRETAADEEQSFAEYKAVEAALQPYIEGAKAGDGDLARSAFLDHAHIVGSIGGIFSNAPLDAFVESVNGGGPAPQIQHQIVWIDISGPAAAAKVEFINWRGLRFTDFFVLYKHEDDWKISGKTYDSHSND